MRPESPDRVADVTRPHPAPALPGILTAAEVLATGRSIAARQQPDGAIGWPDGHVDAWNHVECAMALSACGLREEAMRAYDWLAAAQRGDGSWPRQVAPATGGGAPAHESPDGATPARSTPARSTPARSTPARSTPARSTPDARAESNHAAYPAVGVWHEFLVSGDESFAERMWPVVQAGVGFALGLQRAGGEVTWLRNEDGTPGDHALLAACSSIHHGLRCAIALAEYLGDPQPDWELAASRLADAVTSSPGAFADKSRFSMDWYYPVLGGVLRGSAAAQRLASGWDTFVVPGLGVRCVSDQPWVTGAETCELVLALDAAGDTCRARDLFRQAQHLRHPDGSYWTGWQYANSAHFPNERSSWTAAAMILAADALSGATPGSGIFRFPTPPAPPASPASPRLSQPVPGLPDSFSAPGE